LDDFGGFGVIEQRRGGKEMVIGKELSLYRGLKLGLEKGD
jgi:hypothetical protein